MCQIYLDEKQKDHLKSNLYSSEANHQRVNNTCTVSSRKKSSFGRDASNKILEQFQNTIIDKQTMMSEKPEGKMQDSKCMIFNSYGKLNETPKSSISTDTEVYNINFDNIHAPCSSIDDSITSDGEGYDTEKHVRVIRQMSSDMYFSDNCFYSDTEINRYPDVINHDTTTSNILYEMCDTLNKVPDILTGNIDNNNSQKETPFRYSGTSSSSFFSDDASPNWSPNSTVRYKKWPEQIIDNKMVVNDMTDTDSFIYHSIYDDHPVGDNISSYDNVSQKSLNLLNSTVNLNVSKPSECKESSIICDGIDIEQNQKNHHPENKIQTKEVLNRLRPYSCRNSDQLKINSHNNSKDFNLDVLNKLHFDELNQDIDHEISTLLNNECLTKLDEKSSNLNTNNHSQLYQYKYIPLNISGITKVAGTRDLEQREEINKSKFQTSHSKDHASDRDNDLLSLLRSGESVNHDNMHEKTKCFDKNTVTNCTTVPKRRKKTEQTTETSAIDFYKANLKLYDLSESSSEPNIFEENKKYRYRTSSMDEESDYDPEISFHNFSKSISNINSNEYGGGDMRKQPNKNKNRREELEKIEKTVVKMLEQVEMQENLLENEVNNRPFLLTEREKRALPLLCNIHASPDEICSSLNQLPMNCNRKPLQYKYRTKRNLNQASNSNVSNACSIEDLERSVNKMLSDVQQEEIKLNSTPYDRNQERYKIENRNESNCNFFEPHMINTPSQMRPSTSYCNSECKCTPDNSYSATQCVRESTHTYREKYQNKDVWFKEAYPFGLHNENEGKVKRSHKRATYWPNNPCGLDRQVSYTPSSEEGFSSSSSSENECNKLKRFKKKFAIKLNVRDILNGKCGIEIETGVMLKSQEYSNNSLNSLWNRSMPSLPSASSESSFPSALSIRSSGSEDCLSNIGYYQNLAIPSDSIEYITPDEIELSNMLINSGYCHWNFLNDEGKLALLMKRNML